MQRRRLVLHLMPMILLVLLAGNTRAAQDPFTEEERRRNLESFDQVWNNLRESPLTAGVEGLDWKLIGAMRRPQVAAATDMFQVREVLKEMMALPGKSHFNLIPATLFADLAADDDRPREGISGIEVRVVSDKILVVQVATGSPAAAVGVRPGWEVLAVDGVDLAAVVNEIRSEFDGASWREGVLAGALARRLAGPPGTVRSLLFLDGDDQRQEQAITLIAEGGERKQFGLLPPVRVTLAADRIQDDIGHIAFNLFLDPATIMPAFNQAMEECLDCAGIVIDVRGNRGGLPGMVVGMIGWFIDDPTAELGVMTMQGTRLKFMANRRRQTFPGPVAVLIDELSSSAAELFAAGLQDLGRARIFGANSMGAALPSVVVGLPNGDRFQYAIASYLTRSGKVVEGVGVIPDDPTPLSRRALLQGTDPALDAAVAWIRQAPPSLTVQKP